MRPHKLLIALALAGGLAFPFAATGQEAPALGQRLADLLTEARRLNPELAAAALDADAAAALVAGSDSLPDPEFQIESEDNTRRRGGDPFPDRAGSRTFMVRQSFPLWGKRDLKREIATAEGQRMAAARETVRVELEARVKAVQAERHRARLAANLLREIHDSLTLSARFAEQRYAQLRGRQQDLLKIKVALASHAADVRRAEADVRRADVRMNLLLGREAGMALAAPQGFVELPTADRLQLAALLDLAMTRNPEIAAETASVAASDSQKRLSEKAWLPDVSTAFGVVEERGSVFAYEATVGVNLPIRFAAREAQIAADGRRAQAARARRELRQRRIEAELAERLIALETLVEIETLLRQDTLPQLRTSERALQSAYREGVAALGEVFEAQIDRQRVELELLKTQAEQREALAEIERLTGGEP